MELIINNKLICQPIQDILYTIREECHKNIFLNPKNKGDNLLIACPYHKNGQERHPSCYILNTQESPDVEYGTLHCFTCGITKKLYQVVADCFNENDEFGKEWLVARFGNIFIERKEYLPEIIIEKEKKIYLDESILKKYDYYHPYMWERKLSKEIVDKFRVGYNKEQNSLTFPVYDEHNKLVMITQRSVNKKNFYIEENKNKPVYLLNNIINENITTVYVCESQINALYMWSLGYPAIAFLGTGSKYSYNILKKSGIRSYILALDGDIAGDKGILRFLQHMSDDVFVDIMMLPRGKDVNDLAKEDIDKLEIISADAWKQRVDINKLKNI